VKYCLSNIFILIVDDDVASLLLFEEYFRSVNIEVYTASNKEELWIQLKNNDIRIVLLDIKLGTVSGIELLPLIRKEKPEVVVIAQTAYALAGDKEFFIEAGFDEYISKPIDFDTLMGVIQKFIDK
jgi:DNA-binding response OmpR family regulator